MYVYDAYYKYANVLKRVIDSLIPGICISSWS